MKRVFAYVRGGAHQCKIEDDDDDDDDGGGAGTHRISLLAF